MIITQDWLSEHGFYKVHVNPKWNGGFFRYFKNLAAPHRSEIAVTFGDGYQHEDGFMVWLVSSSTWIAIAYARTIEDLQTLHKMLCGKEIAKTGRLCQCEHDLPSAKVDGKIICGNCQGVIMCEICGESPADRISVDICCCKDCGGAAISTVADRMN